MNRQKNSLIFRPFFRLADINKRIFGIVLLAGMLFSGYASVQAQSADNPKTHEIYLSHHEFEAWTFTPQPNDWIHIVNHSDIAHSIYITSPDGSITNLDVQLPGATVRWQVPDSGDYTLQCWIHPVIHATLSVKKTTSLSKR